MHEKYLAILRCPETGKELSLEITEQLDSGFIITGSLKAENKSYPIINGIPRFVKEEQYADSFGFEWKRFPELQFDRTNPDSTFSGYTKTMFHEATGFEPKDLAGKSVVEFGCGPGRFLDVVRACGGTAIGIDLSLAVDNARDNFPEDVDVLIIQGDILNPPFAQGSFDFGYSIGVVHHTPAPSKGAHKLASSIKEGGLVAVCVYDKQGFYGAPSTYWLRSFFNVLKKHAGQNFGLRAALCYAYFAASVLYYLVKAIRAIPVIGPRTASVLRYFFFAFCDLPDIRWRILDTFDGITPEFASTHSPQEVRFWLQSANCRNVHQTPWATTSFQGTKVVNSASEG